jgi:hypothetical protein
MLSQHIKMEEEIAFYKNCLELWKLNYFWNRQGIKNLTLKLLSKVQIMIFLTNEFSEW